MADSLAVKILEAARDRVRALSLPGIADENVVIVKDPKSPPTNELAVPAVVIGLVRREEIALDEGDNETDGVRYFVLLSIIDADDAGVVNDPDLDEKLVWRENLQRGFQHWTFPTLTEVWDCQLQPLDAIERNWLRNNLFVSAFVARVHTTLSRTAA